MNSDQKIRLLFAAGSNIEIAADMLKKALGPLTKSFKAATQQTQTRKMDVKPGVTVLAGDVYAALDTIPGLEWQGSKAIFRTPDGGFVPGAAFKVTILTDSNYVGKQHQAAVKSLWMERTVVL